MNHRKFSLVIEGVVAMDGDDTGATDIALTQRELEQNLFRVYKTAVSNGQVTGESPATLESHSVAIKVHPED